MLAQFSPTQLIWLSPILAGLILSPLTSRLSASPVFGRWARMNGLLVTPEERDYPPILTEASAAIRALPRPLPGRAAIMQLAQHPDRMAHHLAMLTSLPDRPVAERLPQITAGAKIANAAGREQALDLLNPEETEALISDAALLRRWSALPE